MEPRTFVDVLADVVGQRPDAIAYRTKRGGRWQEVTWSRQHETVRRVAKALIALGVCREDKVCILSDTRLEWVQADLGIVSCGGVTVGIYQTLLAQDSGYIVNHSDAVAIFVENTEQLEKILAVRGELHHLRRIVLFDGPSNPDRGIVSWDEFLASGDEIDDQTLDRRSEALGPDDLAALVYTSGTTGVPKGVILTHGNLVFSTWSARESLSLESHYETLLFLPLAHVFARLITYVCMRCGVTVAFAESIDRVPANLKEIRPHFIASVPRIYEKVREKVLSNAEEAGGLKKKLFDWALATGLRASRELQQGRRPSAGLRLQRAIADRLVFHKIREALGGRIVWAVSGAAPLSKEVAEFFHACGVLILEGIGMTENTSFSNVNRVDRYRFGTVGPIGPGIEMRIADDGEILYRGDNVMKGYYKDPQATEEAIDDDGWLRTGDIGKIDDDGFLHVTDRKKELIKTSGGKFVAPQRVEAALRSSRYVAQAVAFGDQRKYVTALLVPDEANLRAWASEHRVAGDDLQTLVEQDGVRELIQAEVDRANGSLASFESVKKFHLLGREMTIESGELTPTLKIKRRVVAERHRQELDRLYAS